MIGIKTDFSTKTKTIRILRKKIMIKKQFFKNKL